MPNQDLNRTYPSSPITFADVPEVRNFRAKFDYQFFVPDESVSDVGIEIDQVADDIERKLERRAPRLVRFTFSPVKLAPRLMSLGNEFRGHQDFEETRSTSIEENITNVKYEHELTTTQFVGMRFQDDQIDGKLFSITSGVVANKVDRYNRSIGAQFHATEHKINRILSRGHVNIYDAAQLLSLGQGKAEADLIVRSLNNLKELNARFVDDEQQRLKTSDRFERVRDVGLDVQFNAKFFGDSLASMTADPFGMYVDEIAPKLADAAAIQRAARGRNDPSTINASEYETYADPVSVKRVNVASFNTKRRIVGYIIDKQEVLTNGQVIGRRSIIVENAASTRAFDTNVAYNRRYVYAIRAIAEIELIATYDDEDEIVAASILVSSKPGNRQIVDTIERVPPPPPADFNVDWDRTARAARLTWSFPVNKQRDIKRWQVFRRSSIYEPFELIREIDFDDSIVKIDSGERPSPSLVEKLKQPKNYYIDAAFNRTSKYIYALCSIDAHGMSSNYSMQYEARFDFAKNDVIKDVVSVAGAPKSYPNVYVEQDDVVVDVIRDSNHSQVDIYFDPETLTTIDSIGRDMNLLATDRQNGVYRLQLINADLQQADGIDIVLRDIRQPIRSRGKRLRRFSRNTQQRLLPRKRN